MFILPCILTDDGDRDGIPSVLIEAMAMQVPVIATDISGIPELIDHMENGLLVPEQDAVALREAMQLVLPQPELRKRFGENGRAKVMRRFTLTDDVDIIQDLPLAAAGVPSLQPKKSEAVAGAVR